MRLKLVYKGGKGSGHHGHQGRPGKLGGSTPGKGKGTLRVPSPPRYTDLPRPVSIGSERMGKLEGLADKHGFSKDKSPSGMIKYSKKSNLGNTYTVRITQTENPMVEVDLRGAGQQSMFRRSFPLDEMQEAFNYVNTLIETDTE